MTARTPPSPGMAWRKAATTLRKLGTMVSKRSTRRTRRERMTAQGPAPGTRATATTTKSKMFHPLRQKMPRKARSLQRISTRKTARQALSSATSKVPERAMRSWSVSSPRMTALSKMTPMTKDETRGDSIQRPRRRRHGEAPLAARRWTICCSSCMGSFRRWKPCRVAGLTASGPVLRGFWRRHGWG